MTFNSIQFLVFFALFYPSYLMLGLRAQNVLLLIASYVFYATWDWRFLSLIIVSTLVDFYCGNRIATSQRKSVRRVFLLVSVATNLGLLGFFKYFNFFADSLQGVLQIFGWEANWVTLNVVLPVGISFYTFQTMSYTIDIYRGKLKPTPSLLTFSVFVAFFPQLVAGPIERAKELLPQFEVARRIQWQQLYEGSWLILWGLFKKVVVADNLAKLVDAVYGNGDATGLDVVLATYAFAFQIYGDFSGYTDIARGLSKCMGFELMVNFRYPYCVTNPQDFWRNWHISLSTWLRDYLYIPLGGSRNGRLNMYRNLFLTMVIGGLWHGAAWTFVIWGIYQGSLLVIHRFYRDLRGESSTEKIWLKVVFVFLMFQFSCLGWLIFRAQSTQEIGQLLYKIAFDFRISENELTYLIFIFKFTWLLFVVHLSMYFSGNLKIMTSLPKPIVWFVWSLVFWMILMLGNFGSREFIYFQF